MTRRLDWRSPDDPDGYGFAPWLRDLRRRKASGAYVIRDAMTRRILYVGESHSGRLYDTITRHFQEWGLDHAKTYDRDDTEVAIVLTPPREAIQRQDQMILDLDPADNEVRPEDDDDFDPDEFQDP